MFRCLSGFRAKYHYLTLIVASDFDEWKVLLKGDGVTIHGARQFTETKAKESALAMASSYIHQEKQEDLPVLGALEWQPLGAGEFLSWRP